MISIQELGTMLIIQNKNDALDDTIAHMFHGVADKILYFTKKLIAEPKLAPALLHRQHTFLLSSLL